MKTYDAALQRNTKLHSSFREKLIPAMFSSMREVVALLAAVLAAAAIITLFTWAAGMEISTFLGVSVWGLGFIFLGLSVDQQGPVALLQMATGAVLLILALLQSSVSPDFVIASGILLAAWAGVVLFKRLSVQVV